ncbi:hypothetical protein [Rhizobium azibense]|uniref:Uncharacterized protein n=1 Tax=Rhizobium azibense TaxID=1136135 RepID=A0A4R3RKA0_9HYPH|nr:hypothetical protein [Rhizobium azibense]TCU34042.1 hypothetical protein EV129_11325 [Rhizobium azibense]
MADKFISYSSPMVRALLEDRKTNTRRALTPQPDWIEEVQKTIVHGLVWPIGSLGQQCGAPIKKPRIEVGDRLWVKEDWRTFVSLDGLKPSEVWSKNQDRGAGIAYEAGGGLAISKGGKDYHYSHERDEMPPFGKLRKSRFMPKWASRLTLIVSEVLVQRLEDISEADAIAEGVERDRDGWKQYGTVTLDPSAVWATAKDAYHDLWDSINGVGAWDDNPWVATYKFSVIKENIDRIAV